MAGEPCEVTDCPHPASRLTGLCPRHARRRLTYGSAHDWAPIPHYNAPGAAQSHVDRLRALPWPQLVNWCDMTLDEHRSPRLAAMDDRDFWPLFAEVFTVR